MRKTTGLAVPCGLGAPPDEARSAVSRPTGNGSGAFGPQPVLPCGAGRPDFHFSAESSGSFPGVLLVQTDSRR